MLSRPSSMDLSPRDRAVVQLVARFKQVASSHVHELLFHDIQSHTPGNRSLLRLTQQGYLNRIERRIVGGSRGGSGQFCYQLGRRGFYLYFDGRFSPWRTVNYHALAIVDTYVALRRLERAGRLTIAGVTTEPDCWQRIGGNELKPDLYAELEQPNSSRLKIWIEQDMATEGQTHIKSKLERYWRAYNETDWPVYPRTVWVCVDAEREKELKWLIGQLSAEAQTLFQVTTIAGLPALLGG